MRIAISLMSIFVVLSLSGCPKFALTPTEQNVAVKIAARHLGMEIARQCSEDILQKVEPVLKNIATVNTSSSEALTINLTKVITENVLSELNDPLLEADCADLIELIGNRIPAIGLETERIRLIQTAARAILQGIEIQEQTK